MSDTLIHTLLVEDNPGDARLVVEMLREARASEFQLTRVDTVRAAIDHLSSGTNPTDAILLDLSLPDEQGLSTVRRVIAAADRAVVVVMTGAGDDELGRLAMQEGAQDYLVKGQVDGRMLRRSLRYAIERQGVRLQLQSQSLNDDLTGLHNRRGFLVLAEQQLKVARRNRTPFLLLFLDLDGLKYINDTFGHAEGNRAIAEAANVLRDCFRQSDIIARLGGDEFTALAINAAGSDEEVVRARLRDALDFVNSKPDRAYPLGFSVGILSCAPDDDATIESFLERADALMYEEKRGKQRDRLSRPVADVGDPVFPT
jgi:diguanylate cyclase (GGDEF)-like protein